MKRIGSLLSVVNAIIPQEDVRPSHGVSIQHLFDGIDSRYNFLLKPHGVGNRNQFSIGGSSVTGGALTVSGALPLIGGLPGVGGISALGIGGIGGIGVGGFPTAASFRSGTLAAGQETYEIQQLDLNLSSDPGAISVHTNSTESADIILNDVFDVLTTTFGFRNLAGVARQYASNVVVEFNAAIEKSIKELAAINAIINNAFRTSPSDSYGVERLVFGADPTTVSVAKFHSRQGFVLERRANHTFADNRYFSSAAMKTEEHFQTLEKIARVIED
jgi:hypothetical protein